MREARERGPTQNLRPETVIVFLAAPFLFAIPLRAAADVVANPDTAHNTSRVLRGAFVLEGTHLWDSLAIGVRDSVGRPAAIPDRRIPEPWLRRMAGEIAREVSLAPFDEPWSEWIRRSGWISCEPFRGSSYSVSFGEYWLTHCWRAAPIGTYRFKAYFLDDDGPPRVGRMEWDMRASMAIGRSQIRDLSQMLIDSLTVLFRADAPRFSDQPPLAGSAGLLPEAQFHSGAGRLRFWRWPENALQEPDSLLLIYWSSGYLAAEKTPTAHPLNDYYYEQRDPLGGLQVELASYLRGTWPAVASVMDSNSSIADFETIRAALQESRSATTPPTERDAVPLAAHSWLRDRGSGMMGDSATVDRFRRAFGPYGAEFEASYYGELCYDRGLARSLWERPCDNRWTQLAFLERQLAGWTDPCDLCGHNEFPGSELFRPTIERGEAFLRDCPNSSIHWDVLLTVAEAHETAWSRGRVNKCVNGIRRRPSDSTS